MNFDHVVNWIWAAAGLGTAAFGLVEALKGTRLGTVGLGRVMDSLGTDGRAALGSVYGSANLEAFLGGMFRKGTADLAAVVKNGLRVALTDPNHVENLAKAFGQNPQDLRAAVVALRAVAEPAALPSSAQAEVVAAPPFDARVVLGRFELAVDARVDAAVAAADDGYAAAMRIFASVVAVAASLLVCSSFDSPSAKDYLQALALGIAAVPIAPVAKDLVSLLNSARDALRGRAPVK